MSVLSRTHSARRRGGSGRPSDPHDWDAELRQQEWNALLHGHATSGDQAGRVGAVETMGDTGRRPAPADVPASDLPAGAAPAGGAPAGSAHADGGHPPSGRHGMSGGHPPSGRGHQPKPTGNDTALTSAMTFCLVVTGAVVAFATTLAVSRTLGQDGAGIFFQIMAMFNLGIVATSLGTDTALVRHVSAALALRKPDDVRALLYMSLIPVCLASGCLASAVLLLGPRLDSMMPGYNLAAALRFGAPLIPAGAVMTCLFGALRGFGHVVTFTTLQSLLLPTLRFTAVVTVLLAGAGLVPLTAAWSWPVAAVLLAAGGLVWWHLKTMLRRAEDVQSSVTWGVTPGLARRFWGFASARGVSVLVENALEWVDVVLVGFFLGPAAAGAYGAVNRCVRMGTMLDTTARFVTGPMVASAVARGDHDAARAVYATATRVLVAFAWPFFLVLAVFSPLVLSLFGGGFSEAAGPMSLISVVMMVAVSAGGVQSVMLMAGRSRWQLLNKLTALAVAVVGCVVLIPAWGLWGAVVAWSASVVSDVGLATFQVCTRLRFFPPVRAVLGAGCSAAWCFGALGLAAKWWWGTGWTALGATVGMGGLLYLAVVVLKPGWFGLESVLRRRRDRVPA